MSDVICITNRKLCSGDFTGRIREILEGAPAAVILREKDLSEAEYQALARTVGQLAAEKNVPCIFHTFYQAVREIGGKAIHLPMAVLRKMSPEEKQGFSCMGASCHSVEEAVEAEKLGCTYLIAGHIFPTDCKKGLPPRGISFLRQVCQAVSIPVYGIGGITPERMKEVRKAGAAGGCVMSSIMQCEDAAGYLEEFEHENEV